MATRQDIFDFAISQEPSLANEPFEDVVAFAVAQEPRLADDLAQNEPSGILQNIQAGFRGQQPKSDSTYAERAAYAAGEYGPMLAGGAVAAAALPATATAGAIAGAGALGTFMTRALQRSSRQQRGTATEELLEPALQAAGALAGPGIAKGAGAIATKAISSSGRGVRAILDPVLSWAGRFNEQTAEAVAKEWPRISKYVNYKNSGAAIPDEEIAAVGKSVKTILEQGIADAQTGYKKIIDRVMSGKKYGPEFRVDLFNGTAKQQAEVMQEFQIGGKFPKLRPAENQYILDRLKQLGEMQNATVEDVYNFQQMLNAENTRIFAEVGKKTPYNAALGKLKSAVDAVLQKQVPEIRKANKIYADAFENWELGQKLVRADDPKTAIKTAISRLTNTNDDLNKLAVKVPEIREAIDIVIYGGFAREAAPFMKMETLRPRFPSIAAKGLRATESTANRFAPSATRAIEETATPLGRVISAPVMESMAEDIGEYLNNKLYSGELTEDQIRAIGERLFGGDIEGARIESQYPGSGA